MADRRIDERFRKPRRTKGTPFFIHRNYYALGVLTVAAVSWFMYELLPSTKKLKELQERGKFDYPESLQSKIRQIQLANSDATLDKLLTSVRQKEEAKIDEQYEDKSKPQPCCSKLEKISKYFKKLPEDQEICSESNVEVPQSTVDSESPYKNCLTDIRTLSSDVSDDNDFKTPFKIAKATLKIVKTKTVPSNRGGRPKKKGRKGFQSNTLLTMVDQFHSGDVNPDHLQMALAMSKSTHEAENPDLKDDEDGTASYPSTQQKIFAVRRALEDFGFIKHKKTVEFKRTASFDPLKKRKTSKWKYVRPVLFLRTTEERESLVSSKISLILSQSIRHAEREVQESFAASNLRSELLQQYCSERKIILNQITDFYVNTLNISPSKSKCGCLLKNWHAIPGREFTPPRETRGSLKNAIDVTEKMFIDDIDRSVSPDLFSSDNEGESTAMAEQTIQNPSSPSITKCKQSRLNKSSNSASNDESNSAANDELYTGLLETKKGIKHFENFETFENFSGEYFNHTLQRNELESSNSVNFLELTCGSTSSDSNKSVFNDGQSRKNLEDDSTEPTELRMEVSSTSLNPNAQFSGNIRVEDCVSDTLGEEEEAREIEEQSLVGHCSENDESDTNADNFHCKQNVEEVICISDDDDEVNYSRSSDNKEVKDDSYHEFAEDENKICNSICDNKFKESSSGANCEKIDGNASNGSSKQFFEASTIEDQKPGNCTHASAEKLSPAASNADILNLTQSCTSSVNTDVNINKLQLKAANKFSDFLKETEGDNKMVDMSINDGMEIDFHYNSTKLLNVTDYVNNLLNDDSKNVSDSSAIGESKPKRFETVSDSDEETKEQTKYCEEEKNEHSYGNLSQESSQEILCIRDDELNYSSVYGTPRLAAKGTYDVSNEKSPREIMADDANLTPVLQHSRIDELKDAPRSRKSLTKVFLEDSFNAVLENASIFNNIENQQSINVAPAEGSKNESTPENDVIIKTKNVTPMTDYDSMDTPKISKELHRFGLKPLKRQRGAKLLKYIYECTHPFVGPKDDSSDEDESKRTAKKRKSNEGNGENSRIADSIRGFSNDRNTIEIVGDCILDGVNIDDLVFERKQSSKIRSCRVPLQIVWYNFVSCNPEIHENILLYEPLQLEVLHSMLKDQGYKFHVQDLLQFLDKKCITIRTNPGTKCMNKK